jgi:hypothetical protein
MVTWLTPSELDLHNWQFRGFKPQKGGWDQWLWIRLQDDWRRAL